RCVFQLLKKHFSRYTLDKVSDVTGTPKEKLEEIYRTYATTGKKNHSGTIMYAMGLSQHTVGVQNIRAVCIVQLLLGNIGISGGGVNVLRSGSNAQGSTDHCILFHIWPGYLEAPRASLKTLADYNKKFTSECYDPLSANWWQNYSKYSVSFLKAMFGERANKVNDFGYNWMPKLDDDKNYALLVLFDEMYKGNIKGFFVWRQNPTCSGANANKNRKAMTKLDWMVNVNIFENETSSFWKGPGMDPKKIKTEVFFLPCAVSVEKEGSITNGGRWMQWCYKAAKSPCEVKTDGEIIVELMNKIRELYKKEGGVFPEPILNLNWPQKYDPHEVARLINGYFTKDVMIKGKQFRAGELIPDFTYLQADGSTCSGNWLYCGSYNERGNMAARRDKAQTEMQAKIGLFPNWAWCWPLNRRILYNRASVDKYGKPWNPIKAVIQWTGSKWLGDIPDGKKPPLCYGKKSCYPFIMHKWGLGQIFTLNIIDGPFPEHYEPVESPIEKNPFSSQRVNPVIKFFNTDADRFAVRDARYPFVATTYRLAEHWQTGVLTRRQPWLIETQPQLFVEMSEELARLKGIKNGDKVLVESPRGNVIAVAMVTKRIKPFKIAGKIVHQVGLPWCYGWIWPKNSGDSANLLTPSIGDPNTLVPETKAFMVNVRKYEGG
ncbi:MAG TPA: formate dehydrogenase-N subunit alpha, partial [Candidatus Desulfofervidus auxilii]|nr:formate dehydrogenase-N subunit alpha [Candidatus Desulfofervidus auxilii]